MSASEYGSGPSTRPGIGDLAYWAALDGTTGYDRVAARSNVDPLPPCLGDRVPSRRAEQIGGPVSFVTDDTSNGRDCFDLEDRTDLDPVWVEETGDGLLSDEELAALALSADPNQEPDPDAVPMKIYPAESLGFLPLSYMPPVMAGVSARWRTPIVVLLVVAFLAIDAAGLCMTFGITAA